MRGVGRAALALGCCWLAAAHAQEREREAEPEREQERAQEPVPDLDFLEYLGAWAEEDDEWLAIETWRRDNEEDVEKEPKGSERERDQDDESE